MALEKELETYHKKLPDLLDRVGKYVVIRENDVLGTYDTYQDAVQAAYKELDLDAVFLVRQIQPQEPTVFFTRHITPTCQV